MAISFDPELKIYTETKTISWRYSTFTSNNTLKMNTKKVYAKPNGEV
jgi:hypothetical protein